MPYKDAADALLERIRLVLSASALKEMYGDVKVPGVEEKMPPKRPPFLVWLDPLADMDSTMGSATSHEYQKEFTLHAYCFAKHTSFDIAKQAVQCWVNSIVMGISADATLNGTVDCAIPRLSDSGYDTTPEKQYVVAAEVDVTCKVFSTCPKQFRELLNASNQVI